MKISQKQASLLAKEVFNKLKKMNIGEVSEVIKARVYQFKEERSALMKACNKADEAIRNHDEKFEKLVGYSHLYPTYSAEKIIQGLKEKNIPKLGDIEDKIILKSMFASDQDMESFVAAIVKEFAKKKPVTAN